MSPVTLLEQIPLFEAFKPSERQHLAALLRKHTVKKGDVLFRKGDEGNALYIIVKGRIKIALTSNQEDEITLAVFQNGDFFGEMALLDGMPRSADAVAAETTQLYILNRSDFLSFLIHNEEAVKSILHVLSIRLRKTDNLLGETAFLNVSVRLIKRLLDLLETQGYREAGSTAVKIHVTQKELASLVGVSRESINKKLKGLSKRGVLTTGRNMITIKDPEFFKKPYKAKIIR
jgi:CRP/FNR family cyclic AMP-dependent transcriptional regulator